MWHYNCTDTLYHGNYSPAYMATDYDNSLAHYGVLGMKWGVRKERESSGSRVGGRRQLSAKTKKRLKKLAIGAGIGVGASALATAGFLGAVKGQHQIGVLKKNKAAMKKIYDMAKTAGSAAEKARFSNTLNGYLASGGRSSHLIKTAANAGKATKAVKSWAKSPETKMWAKGMAKSAAIGTGVGLIGGTAITAPLIANKKTNKKLYEENQKIYAQRYANAKNDWQRKRNDPNTVHNLNDYVYLQRKKKGKI